MALSERSGWVKYVLDPPYDKPRSISEPPTDLWEEWVKIIHNPINLAAIIAEGPTLVIYDSRSSKYAKAVSHRGRIIVAVKK